MSNSRNPFSSSNAAPASAPPPYSPTAANGGARAQNQYAPPSGPPPGHYQASSNQGGTSAPQQNLMDFDPRTYVSSTGGAAAPPQSIVADHAKRLSTQNQSAPQGSMSRQPSVKENQLELLKTYDCIFVIDDSSSMNVNEGPNGTIIRSRWEEARDSLAGMVELAAKMDDDGVDVHFLNSERCLIGCRDPLAVRAMFDSIVPDGVTPMGTKLEMLLLQYMDDIETYKQTRKGIEPKKRNYICLTDGSPTDDPESVIVAVARRLDRGNFPLSQIGIQFLQVGNDSEAKEALEELDDALSSQHGIRDIVDTVLYSNLALNPDMILKALLGGINRRLDKQKAQR